MSEFSSRLEQLSTEKRSLLVQLLADRRSHLDKRAIIRRERKGAFPLSFGQERLWLTHQLDSESPDYNMHAILSLEGPLNSRVLEDVLSEIIRRHDALRTTFVILGDRPVQRVSPPWRVKLPQIHLEHLEAAQANHSIEAIVREQCRQPFRLDSGPLFRLLLVRLSENWHVLVSIVHHIVADAWSADLLVNELIAIYGAYLQRRVSPLAELRIQYADFAAAQREWLSEEFIQADLL